MRWPGQYEAELIYMLMEVVRSLYAVRIRPDRIVAVTWISPNFFSERYPSIGENGVVLGGIVEGAIEVVGPSEELQIVGV